MWKGDTDMMHHQRRLVGAFVCVGVAVSLAGCDYWPPTLQDEIEQLRAEIQTLTMEKTQLQAQVGDLSRVKQELQGQMDDLSRVNREKGAIISGLQSQLEALRIKAVKAMSPKASTHKGPSRSTAPSASKGVTKSPGSKHAAPRSMGVR
jgi:septal ring factor EnvC (AmiA/AmiB activator)